MTLSTICNLGGITLRGCVAIMPYEIVISSEIFAYNSDNHIIELLNGVIADCRLYVTADGNAAVVGKEGVCAACCERKISQQELR